MAEAGLEHWPEAAASLDLVLRKGGLKEPEEAQLLLGVSLYHSGDKARAQHFPACGPIQTLA